MRFKFAILTGFSIFLISCGEGLPKQPAQIPALTSPGQITSSNSIRLQAIQDTSLSVGAQGGLSWRATQIDRTLLSEQDYLDRIFNFSALILNKNVLPPVLAEGDMTLNLASPYALRLADKVYRIIDPPRFVTTAPSWRDYLWLNYNSPDSPNITLLPKTADERLIWNKYVQIGWQAGVAQANEIFAANLARLKRDFTGMILYRKLLDQNMVTPPYVAKLDLGVTGDDNSMRINDQVLRITAIPKLNRNAKTWRPIIQPGESGGYDPDTDQASTP